MRVSASAFVMLCRHPGKILGLAGFLAMAGTIVGNAVLFQSGRHPAPLFGRAPSPQESGPRAEARPLPAPRPPVIVASTRPDPIASELKTEPEVSLPASKAPVAPGAPRTATPAPARRADAIARLLHGADKTPVGSAEPDARIEAAQRALAKLGFAVKPDGRMGLSTRQALEQFQQSHHLPAGPELSPKMLHELAAAAARPRG